MAGKIWVIFLREVEIFLHTCIWINNLKEKEIIHNSKRKLSLKQ